MKRYFLPLLLTCIFSAKAQDTLYFSDLTKQIIVLMEVSNDKVKYKRFDNQDGPVYSKDIKDVSYVVYKNGVTEKFKTETAKPATNDSEANIFAGDKADTIVFRSGKRTYAKVLIVGQDKVKYKLFNYQDGPTYEAHKHELSSIKSGNGKVMNFNESQSEPAAQSNQNVATENNSHIESNSYNNYSFNNQLYLNGKKDARKYYRHNGGAIGTGCTSAACGPLFGLIPAVIVSTSEPKDVNLGIRPGANTNHPDYLRGYKEEAYKMKKKRVWTGYGVGVGVAVLAFVAAIILSS